MITYIYIYIHIITYIYLYIYISYVYMDMSPNDISGHITKHTFFFPGDMTHNRVSLMRN